MFKFSLSFGQRPDHPMYNMRQAEKLLAELPPEDPLKALPEVSAWLESLSRTPGFPPAERLAILMRIDETGQYSAAELLAKLLSDRPLKAQHQNPWRAVAEFSQKLHEAYGICLEEFAKDKPRDMVEQITVATARSMRALATELKLSQVKYLTDPETLWARIYGLYRYALAQKLAITPVSPYATDAVKTSVRVEMLKALALQIASPETLAPRLVELLSRISARFAGAFLVSDRAMPECTYFVDLAQTRPPAPPPPNLPQSDSLFFFGPGTVVARIKELLERDHSALSGDEQRFGDEFSLEEKLGMLDKLLSYWGPTPPRRQHARARLESKLLVARNVVQIARMVADPKELELYISSASGKSSAFLTTTGDLSPGRVSNKPDTWTLRDVSAKGMGAVISREAAEWARVGLLCGFKLAESAEWYIGIIRRLRAAPGAVSLAGIEIISKSPRAAWAKSFAPEDTFAGMSLAAAKDKPKLGSFADMFITSLLLPKDPADPGSEASIVFEPDACKLGKRYDIICEFRPRKIMLESLIDKGDNFARVSLRWAD